MLPENKTFKVAVAPPAPAGSFSLKSLFSSLAPAAAGSATAAPPAAAPAAEITAAKTATFL